MRETSLTTKDMAMEFSLGKMVTATKATGKTVSNTEKGLSSSQMVDGRPGSGMKVRLKSTTNYRKKDSGLPCDVSQERDRNFVSSGLLIITIQNFHSHRQK